MMAAKLESDIPHKYKDIICKRNLIHPGSPNIYQLKPKEKKVDTVKRLTLGEQNDNKKNKTILLVGETGAGKSTLINNLMNYALGVKFEENIWFEIVEEGEEIDEFESQTSDVIVYELFDFKENTLSFFLTIIDTPGYGSTKGSEHDAIVSQRLLDLFSSEDGVHTINAVGLVMKATDNRLSDRLRYIFDSVVSLFGKDLEKNIVSMITHSDGRTPKKAFRALETANIRCAKNEKGEPIHFMFDNCQSEDREDDADKLESSFKVTLKGMTEFTGFLGGTTPQSLGTTVEVLKSRIRLTACIHNLQDRVELIDLKQTAIKQTEEAVKDFQTEIENKDFTIEVDEPYKDRENIKSGKWLFVFYEGATCCLVCEETCHYPCTTAPSLGKCYVMKGGRCTVCTKKCPVSDHVKEGWRFVTKTKKVRKTLEGLKQTYEVKKNVKRNLLKALENEKKKCEEEKNYWLEEAYQHVVTMEEIALNVNSLSTYVHLDLLIEKMKEKGETGKVRKLEEMRSQNQKHEGVKKYFHYIFDKVSGSEIVAATRQMVCQQP